MRKTGAYEILSAIAIAEIPSFITVAFALSYDLQMTGTLKMQDMKQQERKQRHQNAVVETARKESGVQKCRGGYCEIQKQRHNVAGVGKCET